MRKRQNIRKYPVALVKNRVNSLSVGFLSFLLLTGRSVNISFTCLHVNIAEIVEEERVDRRCRLGEIVFGDSLVNFVDSVAELGQDPLVKEVSLWCLLHSLVWVIDSMRTRASSAGVNLSPRKMKANLVACQILLQNVL